MLWTLWRAILIDLWRLLILSSAVLVTVVAFAATVKPLADGKLTADQAIRFMRYAIPPMLAYTLPFAGGFAATLAYHRFVVENEVTAAHAGGIGHRKLLLPALASGVLLGGGLMFLNDRVIPNYLLNMERMITRDFARLMVNSLRQGEAARIGNTEIHADMVDERPPEPGSPAREQFLLAGVGMIETDGQGRVTIDGTARRAWILLMPTWALSDEDRARIGDEAETAVIVKFVDVTVFRNGAPQTAEQLVLPAIPIASGFRDNPKFYPNARLREILDNPDLMSNVERARGDLARTVGAMRAYAEFGSRLREGRPIEMLAPDGTALRVLGSRVRADGRWWVVEPLNETGLVEIEVNPPNGPPDRLTARTARLGLQERAQDDPLAAQQTAGVSRFELDLGEVRLIGAGTEIARTAYRDLWPAEDTADGLRALPSDELLEIARDESAGQAAGAPIPRAVSELERVIDYVLGKTIGKLHERWALSVSCVVMVVLGAVMAMHLKQTTALVIYLWSFFPALGSLIVIQSGQQVINNRGGIGVVVLWSGVAALTALTVIMYRRMARL